MVFLLYTYAVDSDDAAITRLLHSWRSGNTNVGNDLYRLVYDRLRTLARSYIWRERPGHTLPATAVVHEAYVRLAGAEVNWQDREHFFAVASTAMRRVLVDHAKLRGRQRRGGGTVREDLAQALLVVSEPNPAILEIDEALERLEKMDARKVRIVELTFFGGLTYSEVGKMVSLSEATVKRELRMARAWIRNEVQSVTPLASPTPPLNQD